MFDPYHVDFMQTRIKFGVFDDVTIWCNSDLDCAYACLNLSYFNFLVGSEVICFYEGFRTPEMAIKPAPLFPGV